MKNRIYISNLAQNNLQLMKHVILLFFLSITSLLGALAQSDTLNNANLDSGIVVMEEPIDSSTIKVGNKIFTFIEYEDKVIIDRFDIRTGEKKRVLDMDCEDGEIKKDSNKFRGHWSGIEIGINDFVNSDFSMARPTGYDYLDLRTGRSWNVTFNFAQSTTPIIKNKLAMVGGFGIEMNNYYFEDKNSIQLNDATHLVEERVLENDYNVRRSKLRTTYLTMPAILEAQFGKGPSSERFYISGGVIGGLRIGSAIKVVHEINDKKQKFKEKNNDLNINRWRLGLTARMGYKDYFDLYANYYLTPLFEKDKDPELHPFSIGIRIDFDM